MLSPAACYPVYPLVAECGAVPAGGLIFDVACDCFRHEPSKEFDRLQSFRMREYVRIGTPDEIGEFRQRWIARAGRIAESLGLGYRVDQASDPFFGRGGKMMAASQVEQSLKFELLIPVRSAEQPTACMSFNYHRDHFGLTWACAPRRARSPTPAASPSASTGWRSRCLQPTALTSPPGQQLCATH